MANLDASQSRPSSFDAVWGKKLLKQKSKYSFIVSCCCYLKLRSPVIEFKSNPPAKRKCYQRCFIQADVISQATQCPVQQLWESKIKQGLKSPQLLY